MPQAGKLHLDSINSEAVFLFLCIDGVNPATGPSPASEEAVEVCKDEGMRPLTTSKTRKLIEGHLDFVSMGK